MTVYHTSHAVTSRGVLWPPSLGGAFRRPHHDGTTGVARDIHHGPAIVNATDVILARENQTNSLTMLRLISAPAVDSALKQDASEALSAALDWQYEYESMRSKNAKSKEVEATVDLLLATDWE